MKNASPTAKASNWNLPNVLTSLRIIFIPVFAWLLLHQQGCSVLWEWAAFICFALLMLTDKLDGEIARRKGLITEFGKIADPIADKALMITALVFLSYAGEFSWWLTVIIITRELGITLWRFVQLRHGRVVPASKGGKLKTALQTLAVGLFLLPLPGAWNYIALFAIVVATIVTAVTGVQYVLDGRTLNK